MKRGILLAGVALALTSTLALAAPESLLPPGFNDTPAPSRPRPQVSSAAQPAKAGTSAPVVQPLPGVGAPAVPAAPVELSPEVLANLPTLKQLEGMDPDQIDELLGLKPQFDIPPSARRSMQQVGILSQAEGGMPEGSLAAQPAQLVRAALQGTRGPLVSRWGHILLRRALASRMDAPAGMDPVEFAALRTALLGRMGEAQAARQLAQDVDSANYDTALGTAAFDAYLATGDVLGICPIIRLKPTLRADVQWDTVRSICTAYGGDGRRADQDLRRALNRGAMPRIDVLLAQRFAGAAGDGRKAVNIEWDGVQELTPWRFALARALGVEIPANLRSAAPAAFDYSEVLIPASPLAARIAAADRAAERGILSSAGFVDLYSQLYADSTIEGDGRDRAASLRTAYVARDPAARVTAMRGLWGDAFSYGRMVLTARAAARLPVSEDLADDADRLVESMLAAGLDRNALRWGSIVPEGSSAWAQLALAQVDRNTPVSGSAFDSFVSDDGSAAQRKSRFLLAGLAGLGRMSSGDIRSYSESLGVNFNRETAWSRKIDRAGQLRNQPLVALLAGVGMQGDSWDKMAARHLFHIVRALNAAGLGAEARMIAAEAVARA
ncbi:MAG: hypothetical protein RLZZ08_1260 [Pseudomonadota bacterium]|jgi:hypothetical protein